LIIGYIMRFEDFLVADDAALAPEPLQVSSISFSTSGSGSGAASRSYL